MTTPTALPLPRRILVPVDFESGAEDLLATATRWAERFGASLVVLHVWEPPRLIAGDTFYTVPGFDAASLSQVALAEAQRHMDRLVTRWKTEGVELSVRLETGRTSSAILEVAEDVKADLILLGTHGRRGLSRVLLGSVAHQVLSRSTLPVLTLPTG